MSGCFFRSPILPTPFPLNGKVTVRGDEQGTVPGVQGVFPLAHGGNYMVITCFREEQNLLEAADLGANELAFAHSELRQRSYVLPAVSTAPASGRRSGEVCFLRGLPVGMARSPQSHSFGEFDTGHNDEWRPVPGVQGRSPDTRFFLKEKKHSVFCFFLPASTRDGGCS